MNMIISRIEFNQLPTRSQVSLVCYQCNKQFLKTKKNILDSKTRYGRLANLYCSFRCIGKARATSLNVVCNCCNKLITKQLNDIPKTGVSYCSSKCAAVINNRNRVKLEERKCKVCGTKFKISNKSKRFNCEKCRYKRGTKTVTTICNNCGTSIKKYLSSIKAHKHHFCNRSCQAIYANKTYNKSPRFGINKSKAEAQLRDIISKDFSNLKILENDRSFIPGGLEIDLYIPEKKLAIELNGPCHYIPIFGQEALTRAQANDTKKLQFLQSRGISLVTINIQGVPSSRIINFLTQCYNDKIKPNLIGC